jgi:hypothetical protein
MSAIAVYNSQAGCAPATDGSTRNLRFFSSRPTKSHFTVWVTDAELLAMFESP